MDIELIIIGISLLVGSIFLIYFAIFHQNPQKWKLLSKKVAYNRDHVWEEIENPPIWVQNAIASLPYRLYDQTKYFKGKTFIYRIEGRMIRQGECSYTYYRRLRYRIKRKR